MFVFLMIFKKQTTLQGKRQLGIENSKKNNKIHLINKNLDIVI